MLEFLKGFARQCQQAWELRTETPIPRNYRQAKQILCTGLGGSAIGADLVCSLLSKELLLPMGVNRHYTLPKFIGPQTLVAACSYSGNTEETLSAYQQARRAKAKLMAICSGGELAQLAQRHQIPWIKIPEGFPPRAALGYSTLPLLRVFQEEGWVRDHSTQVRETITELSKMYDALHPEIPESKNQAKKITKRLVGRFPIIYGSSDTLSAVVTRWRGQFNENSKTLASSHVLPEMNHNEIVGWEHPMDLIKYCAVIFLRDSQDHPRVQTRIKLTQRIIQDLQVPILEAWTQGKSLLTRIFSLVYLGDFVSYYLALENRVDPIPVEKVAYLKRELARGTRNQKKRILLVSAKRSEGL